MSIQTVSLVGVPELRLPGGAPSPPRLILGDSLAMRQLLELIGRVADSDASVLITGDSGTGKELVARAIHASSRRSQQPFVAINCAALPASLLESELFGHVKGAFTDAKRSHDGLFVQADRETILLDEVGEMPLEMQAKLLRAVEQRRVRPVGSDNEVPVDVRLLTATNRDLEVEVAARRFRHDLFYRIDVIEVPVPPLCARMDDILLLARHFAGVFSRQLGRQTPVITPSAAHCLVEYPWPGNVRELENCIQSVVIMSRGPAIERDALPARIRDHRSDSIPIATDRPDDLVSMEEMQRRYLARVLALLGGNKTRAAKVLGMDRRTLYRLVERLGLHGGPPGGGDAAPE